MAQVLSDVFANVVDFGADPSGSSDSTTQIQAAIDSGQHVLFPAGSYRLTSGVLAFRVDLQHTRFLSGAILKPSGLGYISVTGAEQMIEGMRISVDHAPLKPATQAGALALGAGPALGAAQAKIPAPNSQAAKFSPMDASTPSATAGRTVGRGSRTSTVTSANAAGSGTGAGSAGSSNDAVGAQTAGGSAQNPGATPPVVTSGAETVTAGTEALTLRGPSISPGTGAGSDIHSPPSLAAPPPAARGEAPQKLIAVRRPAPPARNTQFAASVRAGATMKLVASRRFPAAPQLAQPQFSGEALRTLGSGRLTAVLRTSRGAASRAVPKSIARVHGAKEAGSQVRSRTSQAGKQAAGVSPKKATFKINPSRAGVPSNKGPPTIAGLDIGPIEGLASGFRDPILQIQADDLLMFDLVIVSSQDVKTFVSVTDAVRVAIIGGSLTGHGNAGAVGLRVSEGATQVLVQDLLIQDFEDAVVIETDTDTPVFTNCSFRDNASAALHCVRFIGLVKRVVSGLSMSACRMTGSSMFVQLETGTRLRGAEVASGYFQGFPVGRGSPSVFDIAGEVEGLIVSACVQVEDPDTAPAAIWNLPAPASLISTVDHFNEWNVPTIATGAASDQLVRFLGTETGELQAIATGLAMQGVLLGDQTKLACFHAGPGDQPSYSFGRWSRAGSLRLTNVRAVLSELLAELANLGLIKETS